MTKKRTLIWIACLFNCTMLLLSLCGCKEKPAEPKSAKELADSVEFADQTWTLTGLPWGSDVRTVMQVQGWTEEELIRRDYLAESANETLTEIIPREDGLSVSYLDSYDGEYEKDGKLIGMGIWLYFDAQGDAENFFFEYSGMLAERFPEDISVPFSTQERVTSPVTERGSSVSVSYCGDAREYPSANLAEDADPCYLVIIGLIGAIR